MPPAVSFSKLRMVCSCVVQPSVDSGQPHVARPSAALSPSEALRRTSGAVGQRDVMKSARGDNPGQAGAPSDWITA